MKKHLLFLLLAMSIPMFAQTTYSLPTTTVDYIPYGGSYANLTASDIPVTIDGVPYYLNFAGHTDNQDSSASRARPPKNTQKVTEPASTRAWRLFFRSSERLGAIS